MGCDGTVYQLQRDPERSSALFPWCPVKRGHQELIVIVMSIPTSAPQVTLVLCLCIFFCGHVRRMVVSVRWKTIHLESKNQNIGSRSHQWALWPWASHLVSPSLSFVMSEVEALGHTSGAQIVPGTYVYSVMFERSFCMGWRIHSVCTPLPLIRKKI